MIVQSAREFLETVEKSGLASREELLRAVERFKENGDDQGLKPLAKFLIREGVLTSWQTKKLLEGKRRGYFIGKYKLLGRLGKGGMGAVYLAEHTLMHRRVAIKLLSVSRLKDHSDLERFFQEAQAIAALDHPNIVQAYNVDSEGDIYYLVMEHVDGRDLERSVEQDGPLEPTQAVDYLQQVAEGLAHAHGRGIIHRDIKPGNLLVDKNGTVKILDLGLAELSGGDSGKENVVQGTTDYLAPESAMGDCICDARSDLYSLGCTLYFILTGQPPFHKATMAETLLAHQAQDPPSLCEARDDVPADLDDIYLQLLEKDPDERIQTAEELSNILADWLHEYDLDVHAARETHRSTRSPTRPPAVAVAGDEELGSFLSDIESESGSISTWAESQEFRKPSRSRVWVWLLLGLVGIALVVGVVLLALPGSDVEDPKKDEKEFPPFEFQQQGFNADASMWESQPLFTASASEIASRPEMQFAQPNDPQGIVSIEAEHFWKNFGNGEFKWQSRKNPRGYSGDALMVMVPNKQKSVEEDYAQKAPRLEYRIKFAKPGKHYVWLRGRGGGQDDSCHVGIDGQAPASGKAANGFEGGKWKWSSRRMGGPRVEINVPSSGWHNVCVWMREDNFHFDKLIVTSDAGYNPSGQGPPTSPPAQ